VHKHIYINILLKLTMKKRGTYRQMMMLRKGIQPK